MKKINNNGFTIIELLAVAVILGILSSVTVVAITKNINNAREKSYKSMAKTAAEAAEQYIIDSKINYLVNDTVNVGFGFNSYWDSIKSGAPTLLPVKHTPSRADDYKVKDSKGNTIYPDIITDANYYLTFDKLVSGGYMTDPVDPLNGNLKCTGRVYIYHEKAANERQVDKYSYMVYECCSVHQARYVYTYDSGSATSEKVTTAAVVTKQICG